MIIDPQWLAATAAGAGAVALGASMHRDYRRTVHQKEQLISDGMAFQRAMKYSQVPLLFVGDTECPVRMNDAAIWFLGDRIGSPFSIWTHPNDRANDLELFARVTGPGAEDAYPGAMLKRWLSPIWTLSVGHPMRPDREPDPDIESDWVGGLLNVTVWSRYANLSLWRRMVPRRETVHELFLSQVIPLTDADLNLHGLAWGELLPVNCNVWEMFYGYRLPPLAERY